MIVTAIVAIYGALLSTYTLLANRKEKLRQVNIDLSFGIPTPNLALGSRVILMTIANPGSRSITVSSALVWLPNKKQLLLSDQRSNITYPHTLQEGNNCLLWVDPYEIAAICSEEGFTGKVKLLGIVKDALGKTYKSKPFVFNVESWAR